MGNKPHFKPVNFKDGIQTVELSSWKWFGDFIQKHLVNFRTYVFRGQRKSSWHLESTLDRAIRNMGQKASQFDYAAYCDEFKAATRGRRGPNPQALSEDDWWALGQHHGLSTPLLDWTASPFVALFFAFSKPRERSTDQRSVWAISRTSLKRKTDELAKASPAKPGIRLINPQTDANARLVNQRGLFTRGPDSMTHEHWVAQHFKGVDNIVLLRIIIPEKKTTRAECLKFLNRMNINHLTLFPDLYGSSKFCETSLEIKNY